MRGALLHGFRPQGRCGIIPAYAGSTGLHAPPQRPYRDHPRVCGEHPFTIAISFSALGSSPRMRGAPVRPTLLAAGRGIIPAYAGSTGSLPRTTSLCTDHPRVCGEHSPMSHISYVPPGSSPRMRGAPRAFALQRRGLGIIPAYAGSTQAPHGIQKATRDHPRVCGEHVEKMCSLSFIWGSSPRMRGARRVAVIRCLFRRIIPAYAGSTYAKEPFIIRREDHPRVCGEHL